VAAGAVVSRSPCCGADVTVNVSAWPGYVYRNPNQQERQQFEQQIKDEIAKAGVTVKGPPFLQGEPLVYISGKAYKYTDIASWAAGQPNAAQQLLT
jgi:Ser/Thr protein kinase RdoA (MazF antagonist)